MFLKSDCCRMNFEKPHYGLENWESFLQQMFYPFSTHAHRIVLNEKSLDEIFSVIQFPTWANLENHRWRMDIWRNIFVIQSPRLVEGVPHCPHIPSQPCSLFRSWGRIMNGGGGNYNAPEIFGKSGSLVIWMIVFFLVRKIYQIWQNQRYPKDI